MQNQTPPIENPSVTAAGASLPVDVVRQTRGALFGIPFQTNLEGKRAFVILDGHALSVAVNYPLHQIVWHFGRFEYTPQVDAMLAETIAALIALRAWYAAGKKQ